MRLLRIIFAVLSIACPIHSAAGQNVKGEIAAGFKGYYRIGKCMPIKIHLENSGSDLAGKIVIQISQSSFSQVVSLPSPSRKTFAFYIVPPKYFHELEVKLFTDGKLLKAFNSAVRRVSDEELLIIKASTLRLPLSSGDPLSESQHKEKTVYLAPEDFPESWNDYDAVNSVVLDVSDTTRLNELQRTALSRWTLLGGSVILINRDGTIAEPGKTIEAAFPRTVLGLGSFGGIEDFERNAAPVYKPSLLDLDEEIFKALRVRNPIPLGKIILPLGIFLLLYGCMVVSCHHFSTKIGKRSIWSFAGVPAIAILFAGLCPWISKGVNAGNMLVRQYSIAHVFANSVDAFTTNDLSLLFPRKGSGTLRPVVPSSYMVQNESEDTANIRYYEFQGKGVPAATINMDLWRTRLLSLASFSSQGQLTVLRNTESTVLVNRSAYGLRDCTLIQNGVSVPIGDMPAGRELQLKAESAMPDVDAASRRNLGSGILSKAVDVYQSETLAGMTGDCVICAMNGLIPGFKSDSEGLSYEGSTAVIYHLGKNPAEESGVGAK